MQSRIHPYIQTFIPMYKRTMQGNLYFVRNINVNKKISANYYIL